MSRTALYAGSFDPLTLGHLDIIERGAAVFDTVVVGVVENPGKYSLFSLEERVELVRKSTEHISNVKVEKFSGLLADYVNENKFDVVLRGLRDSADFEYEIHMAHVNDRLYTEGTQTMFLMTRPELSFISSSTVKEVSSLGGNVEGFVPDAVLTALKEKTGGKI